MTRFDACSPPLSCPTGGYARSRSSLAVVYSLLDTQEAILTLELNPSLLRML